MWTQKRSLQLLTCLVAFGITVLIDNRGMTQDLYNANLHVHTLISADLGGDHIATQDPSDTLVTAGRIGLDVVGFSDHGESIEEVALNPEWSYLGYESNTHAGGQDGVVALRGFEWTYCGTPYVTSTYDHINVFGTDTYTGTTTMTGADAQTPNLSSFYTWLSNQVRTSPDKPVAQFNHIYMGTHFNNFAGWTPTLDQAFCLAEMGSGETPLYHQASDSEGLYRTALQSGWHVAPSIGIDNEQQLDAMGGQSATRHTGILAYSLSRSGVMDALRARRVFASEDADVDLRFRAKTNSDLAWHWMGETIQADTNGIILYLDVFDPSGMAKDQFSSMDLMSSASSTPYYSWGAGDSTTIARSLPLSIQNLLATSKTSNDETSFYVRLRQKGIAGGAEQDYIYSAPIWIKYYTSVKGSIRDDTTWTPIENPYVVSGQVTVAAGTTLTIEPGTVIKFANTSSSLNVSGNIIANGTSGSPIYFTSIKDDSVGGDTNYDGNGSSPAKGNWNQVCVTGAGALGTFNNCVFRYGGSTSPQANLAAKSGGSINVTNCSSNLTNGSGVLADNGALSVSGLDVNGNWCGVYLMNSTGSNISDLTISNTSYGVYATSCSSLTLIRNTFTNNPSGIVVNSCAGASISNCSVSNSTTGIAVSGGSNVSVIGCSLDNNSTTGVSFSSCSSLSLSNNTLSNSSGYAAYVTSCTGTISCNNNVASGNKVNGIRLSNNVNSNARLLGDSNLAYVVDDRLTVASGATLTLDPGVVMKFIGPDTSGYHGWIDCSGRMVAQGSASSPVVFTSLRDDSFAGDTNNNGSATAPAVGDWNHISITGSGASAVFDHCIVKYGGGARGVYANGDPYVGLACTGGATMDVTNCTITNNTIGVYYSDLPGKNFVGNTNTIRDNGTGLYFSNCPNVSLADCTLTNNPSGVVVNSCAGASISNCSVSNSTTGIAVSGGSNVSVIGCSLDNNSTTGVSFSSCSSLSLSNNTLSNSSGYAAYVTSCTGTISCNNNVASGNKVNGIRLSNNVNSNARLLGDSNLAYVVDDRLTVASGATLTLDPGVVMKFIGPDTSGYHGWIDCSGRMVAQGSASSPVVFTSLRDDSFAGDTNNNGSATAPAVGDWNHISITGSGASAVFDHCIVKYGGGARGVYANGDPYVGLACTGGATMDVTNCTITNNTIGVYYSDLPGKNFVGNTNTIRDNGTGLYFSNCPNVSLADCTLTNNPSGVVVNSCAGASISNCSVSNSTTGIAVSGGSNVSVIGCSLDNNSTTGVSFSSCSSLSLSNNTLSNSSGYAAYVTSCTGTISCNNNVASGNKVNGIRLSNNVNSNARLLGDSNLAYVVDDRLTVASGATLTLDPGVVMKFIGPDTSGYHGWIDCSGRMVAQGSASSPVVFTSLRDDSFAGDTNNNGSATAPAVGDWNHISITGSGASAVFDHCIVKYGGGARGVYANGDPYVGLACTGGATMDVTNCTITNNTIGVYSDRVGQPIKNCIIAYNSGKGVYITGSSSQVTYCDLYSNGSNSFGSGAVTTGTIYSDPLFVNISAMDYHLQDSSPCIDTGDPAMYDSDGTRIDMGAFPYLRLVTPVGVGQAKVAPPGTRVSCNGVIVTATFTDFFYIEADDRFSGIRVEKASNGLSVGIRVDLVGTTQTNDDGERYIAATIATPDGAGSVKPLFVNNKTIGGGDWQYDRATSVGQCGVIGGSGLNNIGLLLSTSGTITNIGTGYLYIDDGSDLNDGTGNGTGIRAICDPTGHALGDFVFVTGISSCYKTASGDIARQIIMR